MNLKQILIILKLRWWLVLSLFLLIVSVATAVSLVMPKQYTASSQLLLDVKTDPLLATYMPNVANPGYMANQSEIIRSDRVAGRVVKMLDLASNPAAVEQWRDATAGRQPLETYFGELLLRNVKVETVPASTMLTVSYTANDPKFSAAVTNAFTKAYLDLTVEMSQGPARQSQAYIDSRLATLRAELQATQDRLTAFQQKKGIVISAERIDMEQQRLTTLETALGAAMAESAGATSNQRGSGPDSADVQSNPVIVSLKGQLNTAETRLKELSETLGPRHPQRMQVEAQVAEMRQQYNREVQRIAGTTASTSRIAAQRVAELKSMIEQQKKTVLSLRGERDEASVLLRDVDTAQKAYDTVAQRRAQIGNETGAEQAPARVLSPATEPLEHSKPNIPKNVLAAIVMGLVAGLAAAVAWELLDRRVRSEDDLLVAEGVPVIGVLSSKPLDARSRMLPAMSRRLPANFPPQLTLDGGAT